MSDDNYWRRKQRLPGYVMRREERARDAAYLAAHPPPPTEERHERESYGAVCIHCGLPLSQWLDPRCPKRGQK